MRMTRRRRRMLQRRQENSGRRCRREIAATIMVGTAAAVLPEAEAALTVLQDINSDFDYMQDTFSNIKALDAAKEYVEEANQNLVQAQQTLQTAEEACQDMEVALLEAQDGQAQAEEAVAATEKELAELRSRRIELTNQALALQRAVADYLPAWYEAQAQLQQRVDVQEAATINRPAGAGRAMTADEGQRAQWIEAAWREAGFESNRLPELEARFSGDAVAGTNVAEAQGEIDAYWEQMAELERETEAAREDFDAASEYLDDLKAQQQEAEEAEAEARQEIIALQLELSQNQQELQAAIQEVAITQQEKLDTEAERTQAEADLNTASQELVQAQYALQHFGEGMGVQKNLEYYNWQGANGQSGHQLYSGQSFFWSQNHWDLSLSNAYVVSDTGQENGAMSGLTDTTVSGMYTNKHPLFDVRYGLDINLPTATNTTHDNAVVPDYLARESRLGEGWNFTPRLELVKHVNKYTQWTWRSSYAFRGGYDEEGQEGLRSVHPGNQWTNELEYLHTDQRHHYMLKLQYVDNTGLSDSLGPAGNYDFMEGDGISAKGYYRGWFTPRDSWGAYTDFTYDRKAVYMSGDMEPGSGVHRLYYGMGYFHQFDDRRQLRLFTNWLRAEGAAYDPLTRQSYSSGRRFSVSLGYDWRLDDRNSLSLYAERAVLRQQDDANYRSWGIGLSYNRSF